MKIISFAWTTPALIAGIKKVTRRDWTPKYASRFTEGDLIQAYDKQPRFGGKIVGIIRLTQTPYRESTTNIPPADYILEGFAWLQDRGIMIDGLEPIDLWKIWKFSPRMLFVVRFEIIEINI